MRIYKLGNYFGSQSWQVIGLVGRIDMVDVEFLLKYLIFFMILLIVELFIIVNIIFFLALLFTKSDSSLCEDLGMSASSVSLLEKFSEVLII